MSNDVNQMARNIRIHVLKMVHRAKASHIGSCFSIADILAVLYGSFMRIKPSNPKWECRDRFILSKGHAAAAVYATLALRDFFSIVELENYGKDNSILMTHINHKVSGVEFSTGSLGHGLPFAVGKALAAKKNCKSWRTIALLSDGELDEGSNWEAFMFAAHHQLDNLIVIIDYNKLQSLATVANTLGLEPLVGKLESFGFLVREVNGHDLSQIEAALNATPWRTGKPSVLIAHTTKGKGVGFMENKVEWHYKSPNDQQLADALAEIEAHYA
ncbi:transketolase [Polynucleobacter sp. es-EL-1]|uniref:transketolase n=1 Tax=Polynucleobacter sp. es-EL-1 TaxID=1855652 RepID=UPI001BFD6A47|nr:transketolase [Polynucleobacter sp. es-EL-1]QWE10882.1 transketolase [Polynucleobacter sp. es-EL-1]